ncbi:DUF7927 domain-containing protein [Leucobacter komagatae]|uniref:Repeat protein (TIGR01451 family) n=1 Tax=Leucobacter komagatae TaxID=55969 RepID=A0A0D0IRM2_9MICO|nr:hypothetical protein [Leucobacter komagatae]KIP52088.1 hypothetical protein SD72_11050 [Leucobacter komagatae]
MGERDSTPETPPELGVAPESDVPKLVCEADNIYSVSTTGQLKHIQVAENRLSARVRNVGSPGPGPGNPNYNGLAIAPSGEVAYAYNRNATPTRIYRFNVASGTWVDTRATIAQGDGVTLIGGATDPDGTYWVGGFASSNAFEMWAMDEEGRPATRKGRVDLRNWPSPNANGDIAFDSLGNLYIVRGLQNRTDLEVFRVDAADLAEGTGTEWVSASAKLPTSQGSIASINGIAYDSRGVLYFGGTGGLGYVNLPASTEAPVSLALSGDTWQTTDLASCSFPPTVKLEKDLPDGRVAEADQFTLELLSEDLVLGSNGTTGNEPGVQAETVGPIPATSGTEITLREAPRGSTLPGNYSSSWLCSVEGEPIASGEGARGSFVVPFMRQGGEILCGFKNSIVQAEKTAAPASGTSVNPESIVRYSLTLDNSTGEGPAVADFWDSLSDVLDDAIFVDPEGNPTPANDPAVTTSGGINYSSSRDWDADGQWLRMRGTVAAGEVGRMTFAVKVRSNSDDAAGREASDSPQGYFLRNKLVRGEGGDIPPKLPETCEPGQCTVHPVNAWTVSKTSVPGASSTVYRGGNVHYGISAEKVNPETSLEGLTLQADITQVLKTAGWAPDAIAANGALARGVYLFNAAGRSIGLDGVPNTPGENEYLPVQDIQPPEERDDSSEGRAAESRWIVRSGDPITLPAEAVRAEMWFAVQAAETPAGIPSPEAWAADGQTPSTGWTFVSYATGMAQSGSVALAPNECVTGVDIPNTALAPNGPQPADAAFPARCQTENTLTRNFFSIRKDAGGAGRLRTLGRPQVGD